ncbi:MAG: LamG-like jellyroll fold domain-containing protein, partial [Candidatus Dormibacteria bacterium]
ATNTSFAVNQVILIHQTEGTNAGQWERNIIQGYTAGTITLGTPLIGTYVSGAQVRVLKQYSSITVDSGKTWTAKAWNGTVGGILSNLCSGTITATGSIVADATGFRGGAVISGNSKVEGNSGEGTVGASVVQNTANGNGGGGGTYSSTFDGTGGGGGGGDSTLGSNGVIGESGSAGGIGGNVSGSNDLTTMTFGGGGGTGATGPRTNGVTAGGIGGGIIFLIGTTITVTGAITSNGANGTSGSGQYYVGSGGGAGGSILLKAQTATLGSNLITASGGSGGVGSRGAGTGAGGDGGAGGSGRIAIDYYTSYTGTTTPTINAILDPSLVTSVTYQARLGISSDGSTSEYASYNLSNLTTGMWNRLSISWASSTSVSTFYLNGLLLGTFTGTKTAISSNTSLLYVGANKTSVIANYFDGLLNDMRIWNNVQTASQIYANNQIQLTGNEGGLQDYYTFNSVYTDGSGNSNSLTAVNSPTFSTDVPYPAPTTRLDIDQSYTTTGHTYTLLTSISESAANKLTFTPTLDPQKSIAFDVSSKGTGNWTVT